MKWMLAGIVALGLSGCGDGGEAGKPPPLAPPPEPPLALTEPAEITVAQRSTTALPGSGGELLITVDDVTRGQVMVSVAWKDGRVVAPTRSMRERQRVRFGIEGFRYELVLVRLANALVGQDYATFRLGCVAKALSETEKIEALIAALGGLEGVVFIRNGTEHGAREAVEHIRRKWAWKKDEIATAGDFIRIAASGSSTSGDPYRIRLADGTEMTTEVWFRRELAWIEESLDRTSDGATR